MTEKNKHSTTFSWEAPEYQYYHKDVGWYWLSILFASVIVLISLWQKNFLFALFVVIAEFLIISWGAQYPRTVRFEINEKGVEIDDKKTYLFSEIEHFAINNEGELSELIFHFKTKISPAVKIHFHTHDVRKIRGMLKARIPEVHHDEGVIDSLAKLIRF